MASDRSLHKSRRPRLAPPAAQPIRQLIYLVAALGVALALMSRAGDPKAWSWLTGLDSRDGASNEPARTPVDVRLIEGDSPGVFTSPSPPASPGSDEPPRGGSFADRPAQAPVDPEIFEGIRDKTRTIPQRAYFELLGAARAAPAGALERVARRDLTFAHLVSTPQSHRGEAVFLKGHLRRMTRLDPVANQAGLDTLYEGWLFTNESLDNPYVIIVSQLPEGFPLGGAVVEDISFAGYFLKLWSYRAGDGTRFAPLLLGQRIVWHPAPPSVLPGTRTHGLVIGLVIGLIVLLALASWGVQRRSQSIRRALVASDDSPSDPGRSMSERAGPSAEEYLRSLEADDRNAGS